MGVSRIKGKVKWFNPKKGYGFAERLDETPNANGKDIFVHARDLPQGIEDLAEGQLITFELSNTKKGTKAINVLLEAR